MAKTTTKQARPPVKASPPASAVTDHFHPASKRVELATAAAWEIWTLCDEILKHTAKIDGSKEPHH